MSQLTTKDYFNAPNVQEKFKEMLGNKAPGFITSVLSAVSSNNLLQKASPESVFKSAMAAAAIDLPIGLGMAYIVPYKGNAQFQMGYKGFMQLAIRSKRFKSINATDVREGELLDFNRLTGEQEFQWIEDESKRKEAKIIGYVAHFKLLDGFEKSLYMTQEVMEAHATKYSQAYKYDINKGKNSSLWSTDFETMAKKTVIKLLLNSGAAPLSVQMEKAIEADQAVVVDGETVYADNQADKEEERAIKIIEAATTKEELEAMKEIVSEDGNEHLLTIWQDKLKELK